MTTTHASTQAPKPTEAAKPAQPGQSARQQGDKAVPADLFAHLLSLVSDTHLGPTAPSALEGDVADDKAPGKGKAKGQADDTDPNPLATLLAWVTPATAATTATTAGATTADAKAAAGADAQAGPLKTAGTDGAGKDSGVDISGMTRVDEPAPQLSAQARAASRPAFSPLNPQTAAVAAATQSPRAGDSTATPGSAPAMVWQRGAVSGTEALQQQHSAQFAQVRATAAINERLGLVGAPADASAGPANLREFALGGVGSTSSAAPGTGTAATQDNSLAGAASASGADTGGSGDNNSSSASTDQGQGDGHPHASTDAEAPTVSHWGTQHLRHASLRVGGEGGSDAIDIQLAVKGQEVQVAFQTDNAEARATLRESAGASLADLMQRSGIQLGGVSVGSQGTSQSSSQGDGGHSPRPAGLSTEALGRTARAAEPASRPAPAPRADGSRPLDVFA
ncbi:flagellar hook-length control protein FliK [Hydrogenophaga sp.]